MAHDRTPPDAASNPAAMKAVTTLVISPAAVVTGDLLSWHDDDYETVTVASPDGTTQVVLAGTHLDLHRILRAAIEALDALAER